MPESPTYPHHTRIESLDQLVHTVIDELKQRGKVPELPTGLTLLDSAIWGLHRSEVAVIAARPGEGKTTLALQISKTLADQQKRVLFVSLEMTRHQLMERLLVQLTQFDAWNLRTGQKLDELLAKLEPLAGYFKDVNLRLVDSVGYTVPELQHLLNQMVDLGGGAPDLLVLDFIQLIRLEPGMQKFDAIAEYMRSLKELAMRHKMAVLICSQINREGGKNSKNRPRLENLKGSGAIEELADCVIMNWWQELGTEENPQGYKYWLCIEKQRNGPPGQMVPVRFDKDRLTFHDVEEAVSQWKADEHIQL